MKYAGKRWGWDEAPWKGVSAAVLIVGLLAWGMVELVGAAMSWIGCAAYEGACQSGRAGLLLNAAKLYLVPSAVLVAALGVARSEILKTGVSAIGLLAAGLWGWSTICEAGCSRFDVALWLLPWVFGGLWTLSLLIHGVRWCLGLDEEADGAARKGNKNGKPGDYGSPGVPEEERLPD